MNSQLQSNSLLTLNLTLKIFELRNGNRELYKSPRENKSTHPNLIIYGFSWVPLGGRGHVAFELVFNLYLVCVIITYRIDQN